ncbi:MAG TPA: hypothetical protein VM657_13420 [Sphingomonas sp.]|nr:hypothetical protein [Sphingomonas sp.]
MNPWPFVAAAYGVTLLAALVLAVASWRAMVKAEREAEELRR